MAIGFIGLGIMGEGMAARLVSEGVAGTVEVPLVVWNRTTSKSTGKFLYLNLGLLMFYSLQTTYD